MGFNATNNGDVDFYSPYPKSATSDDAYDFYVNYGTAFSKILSIDRSGSITVKGAVFQKGNIQIGVPGAASTVFSFATAPSGRCTTGDIGMDRAGTPNFLYVCQAGTGSVTNRPAVLEPTCISDQLPNCLALRYPQPPWMTSKPYMALVEHGDGFDGCTRCEHGTVSSPIVSPGN
jgi:hypothetical protein